MTYINKYNVSTGSWGLARLNVYKDGSWVPAVLKKYNSSGSTWENVFGTDVDIPFEFALSQDSSDIITTFTPGVGQSYYIQIRWRINSESWVESDWTLFTIDDEYIHYIDKTSNGINPADIITVEIKVKTESEIVSIWKTDQIEVV